MGAETRTQITAINAAMLATPAASAAATPAASAAATPAASSAATSATTVIQNTELITRTIKAIVESTLSCAELYKLWQTSLEPHLNGASRQEAVEMLITALYRNFITTREHESDKHALCAKFAALFTICTSVANPDQRDIDQLQSTIALIIRCRKNWVNGGKNCATPALIKLTKITLPNYVPQLYKSLTTNHQAPTVQPSQPAQSVQPTAEPAKVILPDLANDSATDRVDSNKEQCNIANFRRIASVIMPMLALSSYGIHMLSSQRNQQNLTESLHNLKHLIAHAQDERYDGKYVDCTRIYKEYDTYLKSLQ